MPVKGGAGGASLLLITSVMGNENAHRQGGWEAWSGLGCNRFLLQPGPEPLQACFLFWHHSQLEIKSYGKEKAEVVKVTILAYVRWFLLYIGFVFSASVVYLLVCLFIYLV